MFEIKITIDAPELANALNNLASAIGKTNVLPVLDSAPLSLTTSTAQNDTKANAAQQPSTKESSSTPPMSASPIHDATANPTTLSIPLARPPRYTVDQIMQAGATLMDAGKVNELLNLLHSFGVQAVMDLKPEQLGAFATALRELGAKI